MWQGLLRLISQSKSKCFCSNLLRELRSSLYAPERSRDTICSKLGIHTAAIQTNYDTCACSENIRLTAVAIAEESWPKSEETRS